MKTLLAASLLLAACHDTKVVAIPERAEPADHPGQMTITGTATLEVSPDCADLTMTLSSDEPKPGQATSDVQSREGALVAAVRKLGVEQGDIKLSYLSLEPVYETQVGSWQQVRVHGYRAQITVTVTTKDFSKVATLMDAGADAGATSLSSQFRNSQLPELKKKVRDMALTAARQKAEQTANGLGIKLGRITSVAENAGGMMWSNAYFPQANAMQAAPSPAGTADIGGALQPLTLDVTIGYELAKET